MTKIPSSGMYAMGALVPSARGAPAPTVGMGSVGVISQRLLAVRSEGLAS